ncbi:MAG: hypothetical protein R3255_02705, partial [Candidatus Lokiarchaeia archaeon]|nr:hypothetical protein [Candidatus Lokiarchaeia archaeon]
MGENEKPLSQEEIEKQKKIVDELYKKEKEEREIYLKSTEDERKLSFEKGKEQISGSIDEKAFMVEKRRELDETRKGIHADIDGTGAKIEKSIGEKAFRIEKKRELDDIRKG